MPPWDIAYIAGVGSGWFYTAGLLPLWGYWALVTLCATVPLLPLLLIRERTVAPAAQ